MPARFPLRRIVLPLLLMVVVDLSPCKGAPMPDSIRSMRFQARTTREAEQWQQAAREKLFALMMGGQQPARCGLDVKILRSIPVPTDGYVLEEITLQTLPDRRAHAWVARPMQPRGKVGAVLALNGHGGNGEQVVRGQSLYWYGRALIEMGYVVIAPDVGQHELQHTNWTLMGERTWDALRCVDYLVSLPEVDSKRLGVAGLSLGGETTMYVAALDERIRLACSSGWLTTVANMKNGHCRCYDFPGLEQHFDFADIFACIAPRKIICELGEMERAPGGFPVSIGERGMAEIQHAYKVFGAESNALLTIHPGPHVFSGRDFMPWLREEFGESTSRLPNDAAAVAWARFLDAPEALDGTPYQWLGRTDIRVTFNVRPQPGDALEMAWGAKSDRRSAEVRINGKLITVEDGGHWGFRWIRVPVPSGTTGSVYEVELRRGLGAAAFLSEIRLTSAVSRQDQARDLKQASHRAKVSLGSPARASVEAFPDMRSRWDKPAPVPRSTAGGVFEKAERNSRLANEAFFRCRRFVDGWLKHADSETGLIPRNLTVSRDFWNGRDSAADNYPYMVLTAAMTDRSLLEGRMLEMLRTETRLTSRVGRIPDDYSFSRRTWRRDQGDIEAMIFDGAEYVKDGLLPITEWMGPSPWSERMIGIIDDIWKEAKVESPFGNIPTQNVEVCGDLLQACSRLFWFTGERKYLDWAMRLGDYFLLDTNHPTRDWKQLRLIDHGCEVVNGLTELYVAVSRVLPEKKKQYEKPMHDMFDCILTKGSNEDGLLYSWFNPQTGEHSKDLCDTWGYDYDGVYTMWLVDGKERYRDAVRKALRSVKGKYVGACWGDKSADGFADSIEGAINLLNREPEESAGEWVDSQTRQMWGIQKPDGIIEGWHGDGNFARTSLMYALWKTQGATLAPWRGDVKLGAVRDGTMVHLFVAAGDPWEGRIIFDRPRHTANMRLPMDYPRINQFPEWFTVRPDENYEVKIDAEPAARMTGEQLIEGVVLKLSASQARLVAARKL